MTCEPERDGPPLGKLPEYITVRNLEAHIAMEDRRGVRMPTQFGRKLSQEDADRISAAYNFLREGSA